ncbi:MAG TPA: GNAT family N-acetyltransferase [Oscillospiraceae bacterium]|nr:GNAT family N-acetyltransferase [Oscillospiraceae bacterium]
MNFKFEQGRIYNVDENNELMAELTYDFKSSNEININRTFVNTKLRGQGVAGKLMKEAVTYLRRNKLKTTASCSYANSWLTKRKEELSDIISDEFDDVAAACKI